jgi:hypothetical protein
VRRLLLAASLALVLVPAAGAHGGGDPRYRSTVTAVDPARADVEVRVLDGDDRLRLTNRTGETILILGYDGEPYLRFTPTGVERNTRSPATYLNEERLGGVKLPPRADAEAQPVWEHVADRSVYEWHDHRIHWMSTIPPPRVRAAEDEAHHVFDWEVAGRIGSDPMAIRGSLDYEPAPEGRFRPVFVVPLVLLALAGIAIWWRRRRSS